MEKVMSIFGSEVFNDEAMRQKLPMSVCLREMPQVLHRSHATSTGLPANYAMNAVPVIHQGTGTVI